MSISARSYHSRQAYEYGNMYPSPMYSSPTYGPSTTRRPIKIRVAADYPDAPPDILRVASVASSSDCQSLPPIPIQTYTQARPASVQSYTEAPLARVQSFAGGSKYAHSFDYSPPKRSVIERIIRALFCLS
jgi:hypothetical protein